MALLDAGGAPEIATAGGIGAVAAGFVGVILGAVSSIGLLAAGAVHSSRSAEIHSIRGVNEVGGVGGDTAVHPSLFGHISGLQTKGWDIYLLIVSLGLVWLGARSRNRGPGYVGAVGLLIFLISVMTQLTRVESGHGQSHSLLGWPLILVVLGLAALLAPMLSARRGR